MFTMSNAEFGLKHFPTESSHQFLPGAPLSFESFKRHDQGGLVHIYGNTTTDHGIAPSSFLPSALKISTAAGPSPIRFQFSALCAHWDNARHGKGKPYIMLLSIAGRDGRKPEYRVFETDGRCWWVDVERGELGVPGQKVAVNAVTVFNDKDARGLGRREWDNKRAYSCKFGGVAMWELV